MAFQIPPGVDPATIPLSTPPDGQLPNFVDPPSQIANVLGTGISFGLISLIFVALRIFNNISVAKRLAVDDCECSLNALLNK